MSAEKKLTILVSNCNVKKLDLKAYRVEKQRCQTRIKVGDKEVKTSIGIGLDPTWEEEFTFDIEDEATTKCYASFWMDEEGKQKQIGDEQEFLLNLLVKSRTTFKGLIVPGGKVDMMFTAHGFGKEQEEQQDSAVFDLLDEEGGFNMDTDDEE